MRTTDERLAAAKRRAEEIKRQERSHRSRIAAVSGAAACLAAILGLALAMPSVTARFSGADYYGGMTASLFTGESLGYLLVGLLAFALGTLYWSLHLLLRQETPQVFYVSDLAWLASFATFENVCYLTQNGAGQFVYLLIRGFGTGAMHIVCGSVYGRVLRPVWGSRPLRAACLFGLLCVAIIYHAIYNLLVSVGGTAQLIAYAIPLLTALCVRLLGQQTAAQRQ